MKLIIKLIFLFCVLNYFSFAETINDAKIIIQIESEISQKPPKLYLGVDTRATDLFDKDIKFAVGDSLVEEFDLPPFAPYNHIYNVLTICCDYNNDSIVSYVDFRSVPDDINEFYYKYNFHIIWYRNSSPNLSIIMRWNKLPNGIDSAKLIDITGDTSYDMNENDSVVITNPNKIWYTYYNVEVWFNKSKSSIKEQRTSKQNTLNIYPNPANDAIFVENNDEIQLSNYTILSLVGQKLDEGIYSNKGIYNNKININNLEKGLYFIKFQDVFGKIYYNKFVKY